MHCNALPLRISITQCCRPVVLVMNLKSNLPMIHALLEVQHAIGVGKYNQISM